MPPALNVARNSEQNFVSRSCKTYRRCSSNPSSPVALRAICCIHAWSGCRVIPARSVRKLDLTDTTGDRAAGSAGRDNIVSAMTRLLHPFRFVLIAVSGWLNDHQLLLIDYLREENRVLREQLGDKRLRFTDDQ